MNTLKFIMGMAAGSVMGYAAMALKDKKISFHVTVDNYGDEYDDYFEEECDLGCECGNCMCYDECEEIEMEIEDDYMQEGIVFDSDGEPLDETPAAE